MLHLLIDKSDRTVKKLWNPKLLHSCRPRLREDGSQTRVLIYVPASLRTEAESTKIGVRKQVVNVQKYWKNEAIAISETPKTFTKAGSDTVIAAGGMFQKLWLTEIPNRRDYGKDTLEELTFVFNCLRICAYLGLGASFLSKEP